MFKRSFLAVVAIIAIIINYCTNIVTVWYIIFISDDLSPEINMMWKYVKEKKAHKWSLRDLHRSVLHTPYCKIIFVL